MKKAYPKYKETNLPWLKEMPEGWKSVRYKYLFNEINERSLSGKEDLLSVSQYTGVTRRKDRLSDDRDNLTNASTLEGYKVVQKEDLVTNIMLAWNGSLGISPYDGIVSPAYCIYRGNEKVFPKFFHYLLRTSFSKGDFKKVSSGVIESRLRMYTDDFYSLYTIVPPLPEQQKIAAYLDHKCNLIDTFIEKKSRLIELLKEQKQAIINKAVTKGIDPDVPMKPSGIEWLGEIPEHWEVKKLKYFAEIKGRIGFRGYTTDDLVPEGQGALTLGASHINSDGRINLDKPVFISWEKYYESPEIMVKTGDVIIVQRGSTCGKVGLIEKDIGPTTINPSLVLIKNIRCSSGYLLFYLQGAINDIVNLVSSTAIPMLSQSQISNLTIALPSNKEQYTILSYIRKEASRIDEVITRIENELSLIEEYKTTLIAEAVTGKIDVRDWQAKEDAEKPQTVSAR